MLFLFLVVGNTWLVLGSDMHKNKQFRHKNLFVPGIQDTDLFIPDSRTSSMNTKDARRCKTAESILRCVYPLQAGICLTLLFKQCSASGTSQVMQSAGCSLLHLYPETSFICTDKVTNVTKQLPKSPLNSCQMGQIKIEKPHYSDGSDGALITVQYGNQSWL